MLRSGFIHFDPVVAISIWKSSCLRLVIYPPTMYTSERLCAFINIYQKGEEISCAVISLLAIFLHCSV